MNRRCFLDESALAFSALALPVAAGCARPPILGPWNGLPSEGDPLTIQASAKNDRPAHVRAGRAFARMQLTATRLGLSTHPMSQALQEYGDMAHLYKKLKQILEIPQGHTIQMFSRVGYAEPTVPAPRRNVADIVYHG